MKTQQDLVTEVALKLEKVSFRSCYERRDPSIEFVTIIPPEKPMAELVAHFLEGSPEPLYLQTLATDGVVRIIPPYLQLQEDCSRPSAIQERACALREELLSQMDHTVRCYYCPPGYFVQFTGEGWH